MMGSVFGFDQILTVVIHELVSPSLIVEPMEYWRSSGLPLERHLAQCIIWEGQLAVHKDPLRDPPVPQAVCDRAASIELEAANTMWMMPDDSVGPRVDRSKGGLAMRRLRVPFKFDVPMEHRHNHRLRALCARTPA